MVCVAGAVEVPATLFYVGAEDVSVCVIWSNGGKGYAIFGTGGGNRRKFVCGDNSQLYSMLYAYICDMYGKGAENKNL